MQIKRFRAATMTKALSRVKKEFGPEAVILSARSRKAANPLFGAWRKEQVEVTAAAEAPGSVPGPGHPEDSEIPAVPPPMQEPVRFAGPGYGESPLVGSTRGHDRRISPSHLKRLFALYQMMRMQGVDRCVAFCLAKHLHNRAGGARQGADMDLKALLIRIVDERLRALKRRTVTDAAPQGLVLVGPTGAGKTTTVAKLAALQSRVRHRPVGLVTLDQHRIGGAAQLEIYSRILELPLVSVSDPAGFARGIRSLRERHPILVDTAGFHPRQADSLNALRQMLAVQWPRQVHLVLSVGTGCRELLEMIEGYRGLPIHRLIITKLDETRRTGNLLNLIVRKPIPISFLCSGPHVPEDIQTANGARIIDLVIRPELEERIWSAPPETVAHRMNQFEQRLQQAMGPRGGQLHSSMYRRRYPVMSSPKISGAPWHQFPGEEHIQP